MLRCAVVGFAIGSLAFSAAADSVGGLAAPGDCAQPSAGFESPATYEQDAIVSGSAADHFAPRVVDDVVGVLPLDLTRTRTVTTLGEVTTESVSLVERTVESTADGLSGVGSLTGSATSALGSDGLTGDTLTGVTGAVDSLTDAARTTGGLLEGRK